MNLALAVHVAQTVEHLAEVVAGLGLTEATTKRDKVEELATADKFKNNEVNLLGALSWVFLRTTIYFDKANNIRVLKGSQSLAFSVDQFLERIIRVDDLNSIAGVSAVLGELNLARYTATKRSSKSVLIKSCGHMVISTSEII